MADRSCRTDVVELMSIDWNLLPDTKYECNILQNGFSDEDSNGLASQLLTSLSLVAP